MSPGATGEGFDSPVLSRAKTRGTVSGRVTLAALAVQSDRQWPPFFTSHSTSDAPLSVAPGTG